MIGSSWALVCRLMLIASCLVVLATSASLALLFPQVSLLIAAWLAWLARRRGFGSGWVHGVAQTASWKQLYNGGLLDGKGTLLGTTGYMAPPSRRFALAKLLTASPGRSAIAVRMFLGAIWGARWCTNYPIRAPDSCHVASFSRTAGGKGVSVVIPALLYDRRSMVVTDPSAELVTTTGRYRRDRLKHRIVILAPFHKGGAYSDTFNPLSLIDHTSSTFIDDVKVLATALVFRTGKEQEVHFLDSAEQVLQAMIAFVCVASTDPKLRNLQSVRDLVASRPKYQAAMELMQNSGGVAGGMLKRLGHSLSWHVDRELASVLSTVQRMTGWLDSLCHKTRFSLSFSRFPP